MAGAGDPVSALLTYGPLGLVIVALIVGLLWTKPAVDNLKDQLAAVTKQRDDMIATYEQQVMPALASVAHEVLPALASAKVELNAAGVELRRLTDEVRKQGGA